MTFTHETDAPSIPRLDTCSLYPGIDGGLLGFGGEVGEGFKLGSESGHIGSGGVGPVLTDELILAVEGGGSLEEEVAERPEVAEETNIALLGGSRILGIGVFDDLGLHQRDDLCGLFSSGGDALLSEDVEESRGQSLVGLLEEVFTIEPPALHEVELGTILGALVETELVNEFLHSKEFLVGAGVPTEESEEIDHGLRQIAVLTVTPRDIASDGVFPEEGEDGEAELIAVTLGEFTLAVRFEEEGKMGKTGHGVLPTESAIEKHMEGGRWQPFFATDDMSNFHKMVIDDVGKVIGGEVVSALIKHFVIEDGGVYDHIATDDVIDMDILAGLNFEAHSVLLAVGNKSLHFVGRQCEAVAHLKTGGRVILEILYGLALGVEFLGSVKGIVCTTGVKELLHIVTIDVATLALAIGTMVTTEGHAFVKFYAKPAERFKYIVLGTRHETLGVGVLNAEDEFAAMLTGKEIVVEGGAHAADVKRTRGTRCETHADGTLGGGSCHYY